MPRETGKTQATEGAANTEKILKVFPPRPS
jgi:hypothetical protein